MITSLQKSLLYNKKREVLHDYCACVGNASISALGIAVLDKVRSYKNLGTNLKSGMDAKTPSEDGWFEKCNDIFCVV